MAKLIAHWPLNGTLEDISGNGNNALVSGATVSSDGKLGKCYQFATSEDYLYFGTRTLKKSGGMLMFWINFDAITNYDVFGNAATSGTINMVEFRQTYFYCETNNNCNSFNSPVLNTVNAGEWHHFVIKFENNRSYWYQNGISLGETTNYGSDNCSATAATELLANFDFKYIGGGGYSPDFMGRVNDVRLYDGVMSDREIYDISKAKILHYSFNDFQEPTYNIIQNSDFLEDLSYWTTYDIDDGEKLCTHELKEEDGEKYLNLHWERVGTTGTNTWPSLKNPTSVFTEDGVPYTLSCEIRVNEKTSYGAGVRFAAKDNDYWTTGRVETSLPAADGEWHKLILNRTFDAEYTLDEVTYYPLSGRFELYGYNMNTQGMLIDFDIRRIQIERHDHATEWVEGSREGAVVDKSGFGNHASLALATTPKWVEDSARGCGCYEYDGSKYIAFANPFGAGTTLSELTIFGRVKKSQTNNSGNHLMSLCGNSFVRISMDKGGNGLWTYFCYFNGSTYANFGPTYGLPSDFDLDTWYDIGLIFNKGIVKFYVSGNLVKTQDYSGITTTIYSANTTAFIGSYGTSSEFMYGNIDDAIIYATALSDEDMLRLYEEMANLDDKGNLNVNEVRQKENLVAKINEAVTDKEFRDGLSYYSQAHCQVTLTNEGYRVYRTPDLTYPDVGNVMWGGMKLCIPEGTFQDGRDYMMKLKYKGESSNGIKDIYFSYMVGWNSWGTLGSADVITSVDCPDDRFSSIDTNGEWREIKINISATQDEMYKAAVNSGHPSDTSITGQIYHKMKEFKIGHNYESTGPLGTELYYKDLRLFDVTDATEKEVFIANGKGQCVYDDISEIGITDGLIGYWKLNAGDTYDYSGNKDSTDNLDTWSDGYSTVGGGKYVNTGVGQQEFEDIVKAGGATMMIKARPNFAYATGSWGNGIIFGNQGWNTGLELNEAGNVKFRASLDTDENGSADSCPCLSYDIPGYDVNAFYHLTGVYDTPNKVLKLYINGEFIANYPCDLDYFHNSNIIKIGETNSGTYHGFDVAEAKLFKRIVSPAEIKTEYLRLMRPNNENIIQTKDTVYINQIKEEL